MKRQNKLKHLILTVTGRCNHACRICYYHSSLNRVGNELSIAEFKKISRALPNIEHLMISGGEPFLRKDLHRICKIFYNNNNTRSIFIPTNGSIPEQICESVSGILKMLPGVKLGIMFSLEGLEKTHDMIHRRPGAFRSVLRTIDELNKLRLGLLAKGRFFGLSLNTVVTSQNIKEVIPLMDFVRYNVWVDTHAFSPMRGCGVEDAYKPPRGRDLSRLFYKAKPYFKFYSSHRGFGGNKDLYSWFVRRYHLWKDILAGKGMPFKCQAGNSIGVIEPDGGIRLCELTSVIGNVRKVNYDFNKVWFSEEADKMRKKAVNCCCTHACFINISEKRGRGEGKGL